LPDRESVEGFFYRLLHRFSYGSHLGAREARDNHKIVSEIGNVCDLQDQNIATFAIICSFCQR